VNTPSPPRLTGLDHVVLRMVDLDGAVRFYCEVIGCSVDWNRPELGLVHLRAGRSLIDLVSVSGPLGARGGAPAGAEGRNVDHICLTLETFDEAQLRAWFAGHAVEIIESGPRYGAEGEGLSLYVRDPEGNVVELKSAGDAPSLKRPG
jgi:glyoxylase I family protein